MLAVNQNRPQLALLPSAGVGVLSTGLIKNNNSRHWKNTSHSEMINGSCAQYSSKRKIPFPYHHFDVYRPFGHVIPHLIIASPSVP